MPVPRGSRWPHSPADQQKRPQGTGECSEARIYSKCTQWVWTVTPAETHISKQVTASQSPIHSPSLATSLA